MARKKTPSGSGLLAPILTILALLVASGAVRWSFLEAGIDRKNPASVFFHGDSEVYWDAAGALNSGDRYDAGLPFHPPLSSWVVAATRDSESSDFGPTRRAMIGFGLLSVALAWALGRRLGGDRVGLFVGLSTALSFPQLVLSVSPSAEVIYQPLLLGSLLLLLSGWRRPVPLALLLGGLAGLACLTRAEHVVFLPLLAGAVVWLVGRRDGVRRGGLVAVLTLVGAALVIAPWSFSASSAVAEFNEKNADILPGPLPERVLITAYGPLNFALANHPRAAAGFSRNRLPAFGVAAGTLDLTHSEHYRLYVGGYGEGLAFVAGRPLDFLRLSAAKIGVATAGLGHGWGVGNWPVGASAVRRPVDLAAPRIDAMKWPLILLALIGLGFLIRDPKTRFCGVTILVIILHRLVVIAGFFGYVRQIVVILPVLHALIFVAVDRLAWRGWKWKPWLAPAIAAAVLALTLAWCHSVKGETRYFGLLADVDAQTGRIQQDEPVIIWPLDGPTRGIEVPDWAKNEKRRIEQELVDGVLND